ncbi:hypothetical protein F5884DRAFT_214421 [Xylogone sp. PMI_703]|nr:hypothetical protein F5884DRAFT_214421 [Xylogone sp. PMI_703]
MRMRISRVSHLSFFYVPLLYLSYLGLPLHGITCSLKFIIKSWFIQVVQINKYINININIQHSHLSSYSWFRIFHLSRSRFSLACVSPCKKTPGEQNNRKG